MLLVLLACVQNLTGTVIDARDTGAADTDATPPGHADQDTAGGQETGTPHDTASPADTAPAWNGRDSADTGDTGN